MKLEVGRGHVQTCTHSGFLKVDANTENLGAWKIGHLSQRKLPPSHGVLQIGADVCVFWGRGILPVFAAGSGHL